jgi:hypothetical protein
MRRGIIMTDVAIASYPDHGAAEAGGVMRVIRYSLSDKEDLQKKRWQRRLHLSLKYITLN